MKKKIIIVMLLFSGCIYSQINLEHQLKYANELFDSSNFYNAITEYKRLLFFDSKQEYFWEANFKIGLCYKYGGFYDEAINFLKISEINGNTSDEIFLSKIEIIRCNILRRTTSVALSLLDELEIQYPSDEYIHEINYWRAWAYMIADDWEKAANEFSKIDENHELKSLCLTVEENKYSIIFAKVISYLMPGSGYLYTGEYFKSLLSFAWNVVGGYFTIQAINDERIFDAFVIGELGWLRFYRGSIKGAEKSAIEKNNEIANHAYRFLKNKYEGIKP